ncbi:DUF4123 domain-containing protein [Zooshikella ganghwensis]|uniref:DUF4123 domain-containing protein n=1 Tax=Zooshikella ganghwensis TaxID=202772 RepID=UPI0003FF7194|nr:DUF4123 domain-containing protein [Zooshikella ganghwensis]
MKTSSNQHHYRVFTVEENIEWPDTSAYLLLDSVRFDNIKRWIYEADPVPQMRTLYLNTELHDIAVVSPELVKVEMYSPLWARFMAEGLDLQAGIIFFSEYSFEALITHCQWWCRVLNQCNDVAICRLYDTNLCGWLFKASLPKQLTYLLGPISDLYCYREGEWLAFKNAQPNTDNNYDALLTLGQNQWSAVSDAKYHFFLKRLVQHMDMFFPDFLSGLNQQKKLERADRLYNEAASLNFETEQDILFYCNVIGFLGFDVLQPDIYPEIYALLTQSSSLTPSQRIKEASIKAQQTVNSKVSNG